VLLFDLGPTLATGRSREIVRSRDARGRSNGVACHDSANLRSAVGITVRRRGVILQKAAQFSPPFPRAHQFVIASGFTIVTG
jgi:hypothetical protein